MGKIFKAFFIGSKLSYILDCPEMESLRRENKRLKKEIKRLNGRILKYPPNSIIIPSKRNHNHSHFESSPRQQIRNLHTIGLAIEHFATVLSRFGKRWNK